MIMLQQLPPLQWAVLILRDVLGFTPAEIAGQLGTSEAAVNSALQRARAAAARPSARSQQTELRALGDQRVSEIAARYADAVEPGDADTLVSMLTEDVTWCMPPMPTWFQGHPVVHDWLVRDPLTERWRHRTTRANGQLVHHDGRYLAAVLDVLTLDRDRIAITAFVTPWAAETPGATGAEIFARFGLPAELP